MRYKIKVQAQTDAKVLNGDTFVTVGNNWFNGNRQVMNLKEGDNFVLNRAWYTVESITPIIDAVCSVCHNTFDCIALDADITNEELGKYLRSFNFVCDDCKMDKKPVCPICDNLSDNVVICDKCGNRIPENPQYK